MGMFLFLRFHRTPFVLSGVHTFKRTLSLLPSVCLPDPFFSKCFLRTKLAAYFFFFATSYLTFSSNHSFSFSLSFALPFSLYLLLLSVALCSNQLEITVQFTKKTKRICLTSQSSTVLIKCAKRSYNYKNLLSKIRWPVVNREKTMMSVFL